MKIEDFIAELRNWKLTPYKAINFAIGILALLIYEVVGRPVYPPFIYNIHINDFHIADTLGNSLDTFATIFFLVAIWSAETTKLK